MKSKVIVINKRKYIILLFITIIFLFIAFPNKKNQETLKVRNIELQNIIHASTSNQKENIINHIKTNETEIIIENKLEVKEIDGNEVIGKLEIPKINLCTYILSETTKTTLDKSVTKLCGPTVNGVGNFCITGHNYHRDGMFGDLKEIEINDKIYLTGTNGNKMEYVVYEIYKVYPKDIECLSQETEGERQITLITCTTGGIKRLIVKATEVYD